MRETIGFRLKGALLALACAVSQCVVAQESELAAELTKEMEFAQAFDDAQKACMEKAADYDLEGDVAATPTLVGGVLPGDPDWAEAKALYVEMLQAGCIFDRPVMEQAFVGAYSRSLSKAELGELLAFYRSGLGERFVHASLVANAAAYRAGTPVTDSKAAYATFGQKLGSLLERRSASAGKVVAEETHVEGLDTIDAAIALSDRVMQMVAAGKARQALSLAKPHSIVLGADIDKIVDSIEQQAPTVARRFGDSADYELLRNDTVGGSLVRAVFLHRFEKHAMVWLFIWYRGQDGWVLSKFSYTDDVSLLFR